MYDRARRLRQAREWRETRRRGRCARGELSTFCVLPAPVADRYGFTTSKGFRRAVDRNRARRRLGEAFRSVYVPGDEPVLVAGTATARVLEVDSQTLRCAVARQLLQLGLEVREDSERNGE